VIDIGHPTTAASDRRFQFVLACVSLPPEPILSTHGSHILGAHIALVRHAVAHPQRSPRVRRPRGGFNGKDFTGWTKRGGAATYAVEDGVIVGRSAPNTSNTFLTTDNEYGDFILELDFKIDDSTGRGRASALLVPGEIDTGGCP
jgi:hypothetical protein